MFLFFLDACTFVEGLVRVSRCPNPPKKNIFYSSFSPFKPITALIFAVSLDDFHSNTACFQEVALFFSVLGGTGVWGRGVRYAEVLNPISAKLAPVSGLVFPAVSGFQSHAGRPHCNEPCQRGQCDWRLFLLHRCRISQGDPNPKTEVIFPS